MNPPDLFYTVEQKDDGLYLARCPQVGLVATAVSRMDAVNRLIKLVNVHVAYAKEIGRMGEIFRSVEELRWRADADEFGASPGYHAAV